MRFAALLSVLVCVGACVTPVFSKGNPDYAAGAAFFQKDNYFSALHSFQQALQTSPGDPNILYGIASCLSKLKRFSEARTFYEKTIAASPKSQLGNYSRDGIKYLDSLGSERTATNFPPNATIAQNPGPISINHGPFSLNPLPVAQPSSYLPPGNNSGGWPGQQNSGQYGNNYHSHHHRFSDPYNSGGSVGPYTMMPQRNQQQYSGGGYAPYYHVPSMVIKEYSFPPSPPVLSVELMAKQDKLVADEKKPK